MPSQPILVVPLNERAPRLYQTTLQAYAMGLQRNELLGNDQFTQYTEAVAEPLPVSNDYNIYHWWENAPYKLSAQLKTNRKQCNDILAVSGNPDCREATIAQFVVYFVPAVFQSISKDNRMIPARPVV